MSRYDDERPRRHKSHRERRQYSSDDDDYSPPRRPRTTGRDLVRSPRSASVSSIEEVERDFPPGSRGYERTTKVRKGVRPTSRQSKGRRYYEEEEGYYSDPRGGGKRTNTKYYEDDRRARRSKRAEYTPESSLSRSPPRRRKSLGDQALAALGMGGAAGALAGQKSKDHDRYDRHHDRDRSRSRSGRHKSRRYSSSSRSRSRSAEGPDKIAQAVKAALTAGAAEAFRARKEPGGWTGTKGKRIITAAVSAGGVDKLMDKDPDKHGKRHVLGSALAGLATNRLVNGPRSRSRSRGRGKDKHGRRARSESRGGGFGDLAAGGVLAAAGKKLYDTVRSKSRGRGRSRSSSVSSYDDRKGGKKRARSVSAFAGRGLAALGLKDAADKVDPAGRRRRLSSSSEDDYDYRPGGARGGKAAYAGGRDRDVSAPPPPSNNSQGLRRRSQSRNGEEDYSLRAPHHYGDPETDSDSDLGSSSEDDKTYKKRRGKELITAGLATVATIHAAHNLHSSMQAREERQKKLYTGEITPEEARKAKNKARFQDAASIGIAALGVKGAISEWKEVKENREQSHELHEKILRHKKKREARRKKQHQLGNGIYGSSEPSLPTNSSMMTANGPQYGGMPYRPADGGPVHDPYRPASMGGPGPMYSDGNPYAADNRLPPSPGLGPGPPPPPGGSYFPPPPGGPPPPR